MYRGIILVLGSVWATAAIAGEVSVGFAKADITPKVEPGGKAVWIAGYGMNRPAVGVHDPLYVRTIVLISGSTKIALSVVDLVGLQYPAVLRIREKLKDFTYVMVSSTHVHEGPDVIGMWGERPLKSGVDPAYIDLVVERTVESIREAEKSAVPAKATYGTVVDEELLRDSRLPTAKDGVIRVVHFESAEAGKPLCILLQQNCHPESLADKNQYLTADFLYFAIKEIEAKHGCGVAAFSGDVGGLMALPSRIKTDDGRELEDGNFEYAEVYGKKLAARTSEAIASATPTSLSPLLASPVEVFLPLDNQLYKLAFRSKSMIREAFVWEEGKEDLAKFDVRKDMSKRAALKTEVAYLRLGDINVAAIPGEMYPESIYGTFQEPAEPNADFPDAPLETPVVKTLPGEKILIIGLANDEVGYIIPKRQWDNVAPFAYGRKDRQYGEINSCGPEMAPLLYGALGRAVEKALKGSANVDR